MQSVVYYDYYDGRLCPIWYVVYLEKCDYDNDIIYVPIQCPFQPLYEFEESIGISVFMSELLIHPDRPNQLAINLRSLMQRAEAEGIGLRNVKQLIIQMSDIEEVISMAKARWETV